MDKEVKTDFTDEGVTITVQGQKKKVKVKKLPVGKMDDMKPVPGGFRPTRAVINFSLVLDEDPDTEVIEFDPPFELRIRYTRGDMNHAEKEGRELSLAYWDGEEWVRFTKEKHQFELQPDDVPQRGGYGVALISRWSDPPISWGI
jgi:hypothetical protein